jgi:hypothetical protein
MKYRKGHLTIILLLVILFYYNFHSTYGRAKFFYQYFSAKSEDVKKQLYSDAEKEYNFVYNVYNILLDEKSLDGKIYGATTPLIYYASGRNQGIPINGWVLELLLPEQWDDFNMQLKQYKPVYIFFDNTYVKLVPNLSPATAELLKLNYVAIKEDATGVWFLLKDKVKD